MAVNDLLAERILRAVECIPVGRVATYGTLAKLVGTGPRQVGAVMAGLGASVAWWRVVNAQGCLPPHLLARARAHWEDEGLTPLSSGKGIRLSLHAAEIDCLAECYVAATADLP